ncbi:MAG: hypothetical protein ACLPQ6_00350 [Steroidobacteraceae bacterium]|jgi:hypothetical protein
MNYTRIALASVGAFIAYMAAGFAAFAAMPFLQKEFLKYPLVYRPSEGQMSHFPAAMAGLLLSIVALAVLYAKLYRAGSGVTAGLEFGVWIGLFVVGAFVVHNYANLNIGLRLTVFSAVAYFIQWCIVGIAIGLIYRGPSG